MQIRSVEKHDLPQLMALYRHLNPNDADTELHDAELKLERLRTYPGSDIFIGCLDKEIVASCTLVVIPNLTRGGAPYALIENVVTQTNYRNRGYGKLLLSAAVEAAWRAECYKVMLLTGSQSESVHNFYLAAGFEQNKTGFQIRNYSRLDN
ncbi:GNAT family N-acetyltransferase [Serratia sp. M24T3]|uniref:GNAT family N-acetyltransferase n=1 Tax=Serratia sp. M24T3 TaxID=932213 RepID=UPI00025B9F02|nr:GNAT family N-acetyltransferase [Serratia sp. M24T3]EIC85999.1 acetyltransferase [Serratia sp. M24T3]